MFETQEICLQLGRLGLADSVVLVCRKLGVRPPMDLLQSDNTCLCFDRQSYDQLLALLINAMVPGPDIPLVMLCDLDRLDGVTAGSWLILSRCFQCLFRSGDADFKSIFVEAHKRLVFGIIKDEQVEISSDKGMRVARWLAISA